MKPNFGFILYNVDADISVLSFLWGKPYVFSEKGEGNVFFFTVGIFFVFQSLRHEAAGDMTTLR